MQKASYIGYIKDYEGATLMHVSISHYVIWLESEVHFWKLFIVFFSLLFYVEHVMFHLNDKSSEKIT